MATAAKENESTLRRHARALLEREATVLRKKCRAYFKDRAPEGLHDARVALRKLRTLVLAFEGVLALPEEADDKALRALGRGLGELRDDDILREKIAALAHEPLSREERARLDSLTSTLERSTRNRDSAALEGQARAIFEALAKALAESGKARAKSGLPTAFALPHFLNRFAGEFALHRAWLLRNADEDPHALHALRKRAKRLRYFIEFHEDALPRPARARALIKKLKALQAILGDLQDTEVVRECLARASGEAQPGGSSVYPTVTRRLEKRRKELWKQWLALREEFLEGAHFKAAYA